MLEFLNVTVQDRFSYLVSFFHKINRIHINLETLSWYCFYVYKILIYNECGEKLADSGEHKKVSFKYKFRINSEKQV